VFHRLLAHIDGAEEQEERLGEEAKCGKSGLAARIKKREWQMS
jgi:hypothetical protein